MGVASAQRHPKIGHSLIQAKWTNSYCVAPINIAIDGVLLRTVKSASTG